MSILFVDSSALVKRYFNEVGSNWMNSLLDRESANTIVVAEITRVEVAAAIASRHRAPKGTSRSERDAMYRLLTLHFAYEYRIIPVTPTLIDSAAGLTQEHRLRGYDAIQLAAVMSAVGVLGPLTFLSADNDLNAAAKKEGLSVDNPNLHT